MGNCALGAIVSAFLCIAGCDAVEAKDDKDLIVSLRALQLTILSSCGLGELDRAA